MNKKGGFTLIELMIVVVIVGILAALAIPRYLAASRKSKIAEARFILKQIYLAADSYYHENGCYPPCDIGSLASTELWVFNDVTTKNSNWTPLPGMIADQPSGFPRFQYRIEQSGATFLAVADPSDSWDQSLRDLVPLTIDNHGALVGGE